MATRFVTMIVHAYVLPLGDEMPVAAAKDWKPLLDYVYSPWTGSGKWKEIDILSFLAACSLSENYDELSEQPMLKLFACFTADKTKTVGGIAAQTIWGKTMAGGKNLAYYEHGVAWVNECFLDLDDVTGGDIFTAADYFDDFATVRRKRTIGVDYGRLGSFWSGFDASAQITSVSAGDFSRKSGFPDAPLDAADFEPPEVLDRMLGMYLTFEPPGTEWWKHCWNAAHKQRFVLLAQRDVFKASPLSMPTAAAFGIKAPHLLRTAFSSSPTPPHALTATGVVAAAAMYFWEHLTVAQRFAIVNVCVKTPVKSVSTLAPVALFESTAGTLGAQTTLMNFLASNVIYNDETPEAILKAVGFAAVVVLVANFDTATPQSNLWQCHAPLATLLLNRDIKSADVTAAADAVAILDPDLETKLRAAATLDQVGIRAALNEYLTLQIGDERYGLSVPHLNTKWIDLLFQEYVQHVLFTRMSDADYSAMLTTSRTVLEVFRRTSTQYLSQPVMDIPAQRDDVRLLATGDDGALAAFLKFDITAKFVASATATAVSHVVAGFHAKQVRTVQDLASTFSAANRDIVLRDNANADTLAAFDAVARATALPDGSLWTLIGAYEPTFEAIVDGYQKRFDDAQKANAATDAGFASKMLGWVWNWFSTKPPTATELQAAVDAGAKIARDAEAEKKKATDAATAAQAALTVSQALNTAPASLAEAQIASSTANAQHAAATTAQATATAALGVIDSLVTKLAALQTKTPTAVLSGSTTAVAAARASAQTAVTLATTSATTVGTIKAALAAHLTSKMNIASQAERDAALLANAAAVATAEQIVDKMRAERQKASDAAAAATNALTISAALNRAFATPAEVQTALDTANTQHAAAEALLVTANAALAEFENLATELGNLKAANPTAAFTSSTNATPARRTATQEFVKKTADSVSAIADIKTALAAALVATQTSATNAATDAATLAAIGAIATAATRKVADSLAALVGENFAMVETLAAALVTERESAVTQITTLSDPTSATPFLQTIKDAAALAALYEITSHAIRHQKTAEGARDKALASTATVAVAQNAAALIALEVVEIENNINRLPKTGYAQRQITVDALQATKNAQGVVNARVTVLQAAAAAAASTSGGAPPAAESSIPDYLVQHGQCFNAPAKKTLYLSLLGQQLADQALQYDPTTMTSTTIQSDAGDWRKTTYLRLLTDAELVAFNSYKVGANLAHQDAPTVVAIYIRYNAKIFEKSGGNFNKADIAECIQFLNSDLTPITETTPRKNKDSLWRIMFGYAELLQGKLKLANLQGASPKWHGTVVNVYTSARATLPPSYVAWAFKFVE